MGKAFARRWIVGVAALLAVMTVLLATVGHSAASRSRDADRARRLGIAVARSNQSKSHGRSRRPQRPKDWVEQLWSGEARPADGSNGSLAFGSQDDWSQDALLLASPDGKKVTTLVDHAMSAAYDDAQGGVFFQFLRAGVGEHTPTGIDRLVSTAPADPAEAVIWYLEPGHATKARPIDIPHAHDPGTWVSLVGAGTLGGGEFGEEAVIAYAETHRDSAAPAGTPATADLVLRSVTIPYWGTPKELLRLPGLWGPGQSASNVTFSRQGIAFRVSMAAKAPVWKHYDQKLRPGSWKCDPISCRTGRAATYLAAPPARSSGSPPAQLNTWTGLGSWVPGPGDGPPTWDQFASAEIPNTCDHPATQLTNGSDPTIGQGGMSLQRRLWSGSDAWVRGLPSDVGPLSAVVMVCNMGGVGWPNVILFFGAGGRYYAQTDLFDGIEEQWTALGLSAPGRHGIRSIGLDGDRLRIDLVVERPPDASCCPVGHALVWVSAHDHKITVERIKRLPDLKN